VSEPKTTDYCLQCGESPDSGSHLPHGHTYVDPRPSTLKCWCGEEAIHIRFCREHAPRCRSGAHFDGNCYCKGDYEGVEMIDCLDVQGYIALMKARDDDREAALAAGAPVWAERQATLIERDEWKQKYDAACLSG
jgi:hypothetical protein